MHAIALAQALQFECSLTRKQVIGEWVPLSEPGSSDVIEGKRKWIRGIRWSDIDENLLFTVGGVNFDLRRAPMVMEELSGIGFPLPKNGPVIVDDGTGIPYVGCQFWKDWRAAANVAGIPKTVTNTDSRPRARSMPDLVRENWQLRDALLDAKEAFEGADPNPSQAYKCICTTLAALPAGPPRSRLTFRAAGRPDERYSMCRGG